MYVVFGWLGLVVYEGSLLWCDLCHQYSSSSFLHNPQISWLYWMQNSSDTCTSTSFWRVGRSRILRGYWSFAFMPSKTLLVQKNTSKNRNHWPGNGKVYFKVIVFRWDGPSTLLLLLISTSSVSVFLIQIYSTLGIGSYVTWLSSVILGLVFLSFCL